MRAIFLAVAVVLLSAAEALAAGLGFEDAPALLMKNPVLLLLSGAVLIGLGTLARKKKRRR